ncbi:MAG: metallophosphoesterase [Reyranella sp.]|nr:metallophosphoesterase [Reyranella sp.]MBL6651036.1 metallophosphoesterase [Reyranella sp.]
MARIIVISDPHLSPTHGFFWDNWCRTCEMVNQLAPDAVIVSGDLCINGPDSDAEVAFARQALGRLTAPVHAVPGNHDVGDEPPGQDAGQIIDASRLQRWRSVFGADRFAFDAGGWRVLGINAQLLGSDLPQEEEQDAWLDRELGAAARPVLLALHKPLFLQSLAESEETERTVNPAPRARLLRRLRNAPVQVVLSGHLHCHRDVVREDRRHVWAPSTAFLVPEPADSSADNVLGILSIELSAEGVRVERIDVPGLVAYDLLELKGHGRYKYLRDMPACPPGS